MQELDGACASSCRERGVQLRQAVEEWTARNGVAHGVLTTGFLDGTHPLVDIYELKVRVCPLWD